MSDNIKDHICSRCGKGFVTKTRLSKHINSIHLGIKSVKIKKSPTKKIKLENSRSITFL